MSWQGFIAGLHRDDSGQDLLEYALVLATVLTAVVAGSSDVANTISNGLTAILARITSTVQ